MEALEKGQRILLALGSEYKIIDGQIYIHLHYVELEVLSVMDHYYSFCVIDQNGKTAVWKRYTRYVGYGLQFTIGIPKIEIGCSDNIYYITNWHTLNTTERNALKRHERIEISNETSDIKEYCAKLDESEREKSEQLFTRNAIRNASKPFKYDWE